MMSKMKNFLFITFICLFSFCYSEEEEIVVNLATETSLLPLYLAPIADQQAKLDAQYISKLQKVLEFDLNHNGLTYLVKNSPDKDAIVSLQQLEDVAQVAKWKQMNIFFVVKVTVNQHDINASVLAVNARLIRQMNGITLTGDFNADRRKVHQLSDLIHKAISGEDGIASTRILFSLKKEDPKTKKMISEIWESDYDGGNAHLVVSNDSYNIMPIYVPPQKGFVAGNLFYVSYLTGQPKLYTASLKDGQGQRISLLQGNQLMPAIAGQRNKIAFICDVTGNPDLFLQDFDPQKGPIGKPRQIFASKLATQGSPTFNPKGDKIAFVSNKDGATRIYVMDIPAENTALQDIKVSLISKQSRESSAPNWSPDGSKIAYCSLTNGTRQIWIYDFDANQEYQLTEGPGNKENPTWAPNSLHLMFNSTARRDSELFLVNLNQPNAVKVSSGPGEKHFPDWEPR